MDFPPCIGNLQRERWSRRPHSIQEEHVTLFLKKHYIDQRLAEALREILALKERVAALAGDVMPSR